MVDVKVKGFGAGAQNVVQKAVTNKAQKEQRGVVAEAMKARGLVPETR